MSFLIGDLTAAIATLLLGCFLAYAVYSVTAGKCRSEPHRIKLYYLGSKAIVSGVWLVIVLGFVYPSTLLAVLAGLATVINGVYFLFILLAVLIVIFSITIGKSARVSFKDGSLKVYPGHYLSDAEHFYFIEGGIHSVQVKKAEVEKIELVRGLSLPSVDLRRRISNWNTLNNSDKISLIDSVLLLNGDHFMCVVFTFVSIILWSLKGG